MSLYYTEHIQMIYDDNIPLTKVEKSKTKVSPIYQGSIENNNTGTAYQVIWIDARNRRFEITVRVSSDLIIKDFIQMIIGEFNQLFKKEDIDQFFFANETFIYELYDIDQDQKPNEELPPYDDNQKLRKTNCSTFALKQTIPFFPSLMVSSMSDPQSCKSPISPRSEEEKINPYNKTIQNTDLFTQESDKQEVQEEPKIWCICCCQF